MINIEYEYKELFEKVKEGEQSLAINLLPVHERYMFLGINQFNLSRLLLVSLEGIELSVENIKQLPNVRGLSVYKEYFNNLGPIHNDSVLVFEQEKDQDEKIFEAFIQNLVNNIVYQKEELIIKVHSVLERWKHFFSNSNIKRLSEQEQQGLFGEIRFISEWIDFHSHLPPSLVQHWEGPNSNRFDFVTLKAAVEIKASSVKINKHVKISSERQLLVTEAINNLYLMVYFIEKSLAYGETLDQAVSELKEKLQSYPETLVHLENKLLDNRFEEGLYNDVRFFIEDKEVYHVTGDFPRILSQDLSKGIKNVKYEVDLDQCSDYKCNHFEVLALLGG
ncbi:PD-(D/E)XK motif protein [Bacillus sp. E(2018)]|uniref:PD-(D/E)XK motif protein n=1 Tax=Bacillus sp. E(2018) TaxID=2502239 RepID=UPI0010F7AEB2|nr:PD-(D/E)XK motif protein [Bacillus sp. E(2018)]